MYTARHEWDYPPEPSPGDLRYVNITEFLAAAAESPRPVLRRRKPPRKPMNPNWWPVITFALIALVVALYSAA